MALSQGKFMKIMMKTIRFWGFLLNFQTRHQGHVLQFVVSRQAEIPEGSWQEVCQVLTQLAAMGLAKVKEAEGPRGAVLDTYQ
jgi:hypothetical protein